MTQQSKEGDLERLWSIFGKRPDATAHFLASIVEYSDDAILTKDLASIIRSWNKGAEHLYGYTAEEALGKSVTMLIPPDRQNEEQAILERIQRGERVDHYETVRQRKDGNFVEISLTVSPIRTADGHIIGASNIARDITERKRAHERQQFLIRELQHRTQNLFSVIQAVVNRTLIEPRTLAQAKDVLNGRLQALAQAHALLAEAAWEGAPLTELITRTLAAFSDHLTIGGCDIMVNPMAAQQFALAIHELATNAVKYGALSAPSGRISIKCDVERVDGTFSFLWKETGGPIVLPPKRKGFGSTILLERAKQFGNRVALDYEPDGLRYEVSFPLSAIEVARNEKAEC
jgi:PAS domain S-box-containing protein